MEKRCTFILRRKIITEGDYFILNGMLFQDLAPAYLMDLNPITTGGGHKVPAAQIILCSAVSSIDTELKLGDFSSNLTY